MEKTILIAEDNEMNLKLIYDILEAKGYSIIVAQNGKEAMVKIKENADSLDLILLDIQLPEISGLDVLKMIKILKMTKEIPVFIVSAYAMDCDIQKAKKLGCDDYITKPINLPKFVKRVEDFLG